MLLRASVIWIVKTWACTLTLYHTIPTFNNPKEEGFGKHCGKSRKCWKPAFSTFPTVFSTTLSKRENVMTATCNMSSANASSLVLSKNLSFGKELTLSQTSPVYMSAVQVF